MKRNTSVKWITSVIFLTLISVTITLFVAFSKVDFRDLSWWLSLVSLVTAELVSCTFTFKLLSSGPDFKAAFPNYLSIGMILFFYNVAVLVHIILFWLILDVPSKVYFWIHLVTFAVAFILALLLGMIQTFVGRQEKDERKRQHSMKKLQMVVHGARLELERWEHPERDQLLALVNKLDEQAQYSDPISHSTMVLEEAHLMEKAVRLEEGVRSAVRDQHTLYSADELRGMIQELSNSIQLRNDQLMTLK
ncbi:hypothetical protein [Paenibacillus sp. UMB4589-SE434]|uniref:hypothetical protein n=1 Tax=Paenibacillus sp. UMB4589-SE434 TaxID=3046314 RepID=UPI00254CAA3E|nr:hypothetical protein [Paenibacillus sp. UMB4589-SE434]MDK8181770.1 hypothetical protein [Paenibacillus sp. UMB4589-SE434]